MNQINRVNEPCLSQQSIFDLERILNDPTVTSLLMVGKGRETSVAKKWRVKNDGSVTFYKHLSPLANWWFRDEKKLSFNDFMFSLIQILSRGKEGDIPKTVEEAKTMKVGMTIDFLNELLDGGNYNEIVKSVFVGWYLGYSNRDLVRNVEEGNTYNENTTRGQDIIYNLVGVPVSVFGGTVELDLSDPNNLRFRGRNHK